MKPDETVARINELILPVLEAQEVELVDTEFIKAGKRYTLRLFLDKPGGIKLDDCASLSRILGEIIDVHDIIDHPYTLEVSSPGLTRPLKKVEDYQRFAGRLVRITIRSGAGKKSLFRGELRGLEGESVVLQEGSQVFHLPLADIVKARLDIDF
jgi:ribosome maturation factor RimP